MEDLLRDSQTLPFLKGTSINLHVLKREIDRRITKIRSMLEVSQIDFQQQNLQVRINTGCQTSPNQHQGRVQKTIHRRIMSSHDRKILIEENKDGYCRPSLPFTQQTRRKDVENEDVQSYNVRVRVSDYLSGGKRGGKPICENKKPTDKDNLLKLEFQSPEEDKLFNNIEFCNHKSWKNSHNFLKIEHSSCKYIISESVSAEPSIEYDSMNSEEQSGKKSFSTINQRQLSAKKVRYTERTALPQANRIIVSEVCKERIVGTIQGELTKNRREPNDNKLRSNLIKKIEEKYGEYYEKI